MTQVERAAIFADVFDEMHVGGIRDSLVRADVGMQPLPERLTARVAMRDDAGVDAELLTSHPTNIDVAATINGDRAADGARRVQRIGANLYALPQSTTVKFRPIAPSAAPAGATAEQRDKARGGQTVEYTSATPLSGLDASYDDVTRPASGPDIPLIRGRLRVRDLPTQMSVSQLGSFTDFGASGTGIGSIEAEFALNGDLVARRTPRPGVRFVRGTTNAQGKQPLAIAARIDGVRRVSMDNLEGRTVLDVGIKRQPFDVDMTDAPGGMTAEAQIEDLPADAKVQFLPARPATDDSPSAAPEPLRVRYDAGGHAIGRIGYKATFAEAIGGAVNQIEGHLTELPPAIDVTAALEDEIYEFNASKPFGEIEALARNTKAVQANTQPELTAGSTGVSAVVRDNGPLAARARLIGLKNVTADLGEQRYHVEIGAVPFEARALVDEVRDGEVLARELLGTIDKLPASVDVAFKKQDGQQVITYKGAPGVGKLALELRGDKLYAPQPKVNRVRAAVFGVPEEITLTLGAAGKLEFDAGPGISKIEGLVTSGPDPAFPADRHAAYVESGENIVAKVQLLGFKRFKFDPDPLDVTFETAQSLPLDVDAKLDLDGNGSAEMTGALDIRNVPATMRAQLEKDGSATYDGSTEIDSIDVTASGLPDVPDLPVKLHSVSVGVDSVPRHIEAGYGDDGRIQFRGEDETGALDGVGAVEVGAATANPPALPTGLADSHIAFRHAGQQLAGRVRLAGLREIDVKPSPLDVTLDTDVLQELDVDAASDAAADGTSEKTLTAQLRSNITRLTLKDDAGRKRPADRRRHRHAARLAQRQRQGRQPAARDQHSRAQPARSPRGDRRVAFPSSERPDRRRPAAPRQRRQRWSRTRTGSTQLRLSVNGGDGGLDDRQPASDRRSPPDGADGGQAGLEHRQGRARAARPARRHLRDLAAHRDRHGRRPIPGQAAGAARQARPTRRRTGTSTSCRRTCCSSCRRCLTCRCATRPTSRSARSRSTRRSSRACSRSPR